ncbi:unnamed protein product [Cercopithifilaria johnstoni]|uniref:Uncharacterized protein n=1 Tax=Cercopithifilaria johnstoni TaxID=2874296 RepID=A0A8J2M1W9_9BILA|nr:unnamed protein product [Cercopithifilaria johnstoni]
MKKSDELNSQSQENSSIAVHGLRRFNIRQRTTLSSSSTLGNCKDIEVSGTSRSMNQDGQILNSLHTTENDVGATYFRNHDDIEWTKNDISVLKSVIKSSYIGVEPGSSADSIETNHSRADGGTSQRLQKIVPCGYAPNRFPVTVTSTPQFWPKTCYGNPAYAFSNTINLPSTRIILGSSSMTQTALSTSSFGISSANEQIDYSKSPSASDASPGEKPQTLLIGLLRRFENGMNTSRVLQMECKKFSKVDLGNEFFSRKLSFPRHSAVKECAGANDRELQLETLDKKEVLWKVLTVDVMHY